MKTIRTNLTSKDGMAVRNTVFLMGLFILLVLCFGCATVGKDFSGDKVANIQIGKTTMDEIRTMFGAPWRTGMEDGQRTWTYGKYKYGILGQKDAKDLVIRFDDNDVVASYTFSSTENP